MAAGRRVALMCIDPWERGLDHKPFNYAVRRIWASLLASGLPDVEVRLIERFGATIDRDEILAELEAFQPDVIGASAYVWSFPTFLDVIERHKERHPGVKAVLGGPSARPAMFALAPFVERRWAIDALVLGEGEEAFVELVALRSRDPDSLATVPGLALPSAEGFRSTESRALREDLDSLASVYAHGLAPASFSGHLETYRGCPLSCSFCQWGDGAPGARTFSAKTIASELLAIERAGSRSVMVIDAALNLNSRAFRNLVAAEQETGVLARTGLDVEIYPSRLNDEHLAFLRRVRVSSLGVGLQSYDRDVLAKLQRPFDEARFERVVRDLSSMNFNVTIEVILGLPGDNRASFMRTLARAQELPCDVRVFHCLVLPDALMTRAPASAAMRFDPFTLQMRECSGWSERDLRETADHLSALDSTQAKGSSSFWLFPVAARRSSPASAPPPPELAGEKIRSLGDASRTRLDEAARRATDDLFRVDGVTWEGDVVRIESRIDGHPLVVELRPASSRSAHFIAAGSALVSYRGQASDSTLAILERFATRLPATLSRLVTGAALERRTLPVV